MDNGATGYVLAEDGLLGSVATAAQALLTSSNLDQAIDRALGVVGRALDADRICLFEVHPHPQTEEALASRRYEWLRDPAETRPGAVPQNVSLQGSLPRWHALLSAGDVLHGAAREFPDAERAWLESQGIRSVLIVPIMMQERWMGFVCFEDRRRERVWSPGDRSILQALAACLGGTMSRRQSEQAMRSSVRKYRSLFETSRDGIIIVDMDGRIEDANPAYLDMLGYGFEDLAGLTYQALTPAQWTKLDADILREQVLPRGYSDEYEKEYLRRDGTAHPASVRVWLVRDDEGRPARMWRIVRDISERKMMEQALRANERQLRTIVDKLPVGVWLTDAQGRVILCNPAGERIWGGARFAGIEQYGQYKGWWHGTGRRLQPHEWAPVRALNRGETYVNEVIDIEDVNGVRKTISYSALPVRDDANRIAGIVVINEDITERTRAEQHLRQSGERHRRITEALADYVYTVWVEDGRAVGTDHGAACEAVTGYSRDDFYSNPYLWLRMVVEEDRAAVLEQGRRSLAGEDVAPLEHRIMRKDGRIRWVRNTVVLHRDPQGRLLCYDGVIQDVSDRKRSEASLRFTQFALDASSVPAYWLDSEGRIVYANSAAAAALGYTLEELHRMRLWDIDPAFKSERWVGFWGRLKRDRSLVWEGSGRAKDGRLFPTEAFSTFLELDGTERCFVFAHDITERRRSEEAQGS